MRAAVLAACVVSAVSDCRGQPEGTCLSPALGGKCQAPEYKYSNVLPVQMRQQWDDSDGYCGSLATQTILLANGAYVSQDHVRRAVPGSDRGPGTGAELYYENIGPALDTLKFNHDDWDWENQPTPQWKNYLVWMKKHLVAGHGLVWMISDKSYETKNYTRANGLKGPNFGHEEPVFGIYSNHPFDDVDTYYPDDVLVHGSDYCAGAHTEGPRNYRTFESLPDNDYMSGNCGHAQGTIGQYPCIMEDQDLGFAILGPVEDTPSIPVSLKLDRFDEPANSRMSIYNPADVSGVLTVHGPLAVGEQYTILRWDDYTKVPTSGDYLSSDYDHATTFTAEGSTHEFQDPVTFKSSGTTYYRCVKGVVAVV